jgi:flagellar biosynthetic protein FliR
VPLLTNLEPSLSLLGLGAARTVPLAWSIPVFGGPALPSSSRLALGIGLTVLCYPWLAANPPPPNAVLWILLVARELLVGVVMGLVLACMFRAAEAAGALTDLARGGRSAELLSPVGGDGSSPLGVLLLLLASLLFLEIGGVGQVAAALARSYEAIPIGAAGALGPPTRSAALLAIAATGKLIEAAIGLAAPALVALLLADLGLGVVGRAVPALPVHAAGVPLRALLGVGVVLLVVGALDVAIQGGFRAFFALLEATLRSVY